MPSASEMQHILESMWQSIAAQQLQNSQAQNGEDMVTFVNTTGLAGAGVSVQTQEDPVWTPPAAFGGLPSSLNEKKISTPKKKGNKIYNLPLIEAFSGKLRGKATEGEIGLEIECEGMNLFDKPISYWATHTDNSLRAVKDHPPIEYVLRKPLSRADTTKALTYLTKKLKEAGSTIVDSTRTSVHVHVNCQKLTLKQVYQIWCYYSIFEEMLIEFSGNDRRGNLFCLGGKQAEQNVIVMEQAIQNESFGDLFDNNLRYTSCNVASIGKFGSLEFRSMRGTVDQGLIQLWIDLLLVIKDKALEYRNPREIVKHFMQIGPDSFLQQAFASRPDILTIFTSKPDCRQSMWDGLRMMRDVAYAIKWEEFDPSLVEQTPASAGTLGDLGPTLFETAPGVWMKKTEGRWFMTNYNSLPVINAPTLYGRTINIEARRVYRISEEGAYISNTRSLNPHEVPPTETNFIDED